MLTQFLVALASAAGADAVDAARWGKRANLLIRALHKRKLYLLIMKVP